MGRITVFDRRRDQPNTARRYSKLRRPIYTTFIGAHLTAGKQVRCEGKARDRFGRLVALCNLNGDDLGVLLVSEGWAWAERRSAKIYRDAERRAGAKG